MKILHIVPSYIPAHRYGGPIESVHNLNIGLVKNGTEVTVYTTNIDGKNNLNVPIGVPVIKDGVKIYYFEGSENIFLRHWFFSSGMRKALAENGKQFDIFHITSIFLAASTLGAYYAKKFRKPYIISPRGSLMVEALNKKSFKKRLYLFLVEKINLKNATIHFTTDIERQEYFDFNLPLKNALIIPNGIDIGEFNRKISQKFFREKFKISDDKKVILFLGRLSWIKGFDTLIPAFAEVIKKEPSAVLVIAGGDDEGYKKEIDKMISNQKLKFGESVIFTGMMTGNDKIAAYQDSDIFVMPSYSESFGMSVVEAMAIGLPVVVTKGVGVATYIKQAYAGVVVEKNVNDLGEAIILILNDNNLGKEMGKRGKKMIEDEFSQNAIAKKFLKEYNTLINN